MMKKERLDLDDVVSLYSVLDNEKYSTEFIKKLLQQLETALDDVSDDDDREKTIYKILMGNAVEGKELAKQLVSALQRMTDKLKGKDAKK